MKRLLFILLTIPFTVFSQINDTWDAVQLGEAGIGSIYIGDKLVWEKSIVYVPAPELVWELNDYSNSTVQDATPNNNDGSVLNSNYVNYGQTGVLSTAYEFTNDVSAISNVDNLKFGIGTSYTVSFWVNGSNTSLSNDFLYEFRIGGYTGGYEGLAFAYSPGGGDLYPVFTYYTSSSSVNTVYPTATISNNQWHYVTLVRTASNVTMYVDGSLSFSSSISGASFFEGTYAIFVLTSTTENSFLGKYDQVSLFNTPLGLYQHKYLYNNSNGIIYNNWNIQ